MVPEIPLTLEQFRVLTERGPIGVGLLDSLTGQILYVNEKYCAMMGYAREELLRLTYMQITHADDLPADLALMEQLRAGNLREFTLDKRLLRKDGTAFWVNLKVSPTWSPGSPPDTHIAIIEDISDRKYAEETLRRLNETLELQVAERTASLREQQDRLSAILNTVVSAIITIDQHGIIQSVNHAAEQMFGYSASEMTGQNVRILMPSPYQEEHNDYIRRYLTTGQARVIGGRRELYAQRKDGTVFSVELLISQLERLNLFTGILNDITERKELEREVVEIASMEQLRIGQYLHDDCGQKLMALGLLQDGFIQSLPVHMTEHVAIARKIQAQIKDVLRQVRSISRGLAHTVVDPGQLPSALLELTERLSETSGIHCLFKGEVVVPLEEPSQATHLYHIAQEACTNALKHANAKNILVRLHSTNEAILLEVLDDGVGMAKDAREGLGRRIMHNRASVIGGQLLIAPVTPRGTRITCSLKKEHLYGTQFQEGASRQGTDRR